jgi:hypothetical protein
MPVALTYATYSSFSARRTSARHSLNTDMGRSFWLGKIVVRQALSRVEVTGANGR